jgi:hypothetical protein
MVRCTKQGAQGQARSICHSRANTLMSKTVARPAECTPARRTQKARWLTT